jgi:L-fuculose-phosphate aldolase
LAELEDRAAPLDERTLREDMVVFSRELVDADLVEFRGGNLSVRLNHDEMLITRTKVKKGQLTGADIVRTAIWEYDENASIASSALEIHQAIYRTTDAGAVIHAHGSRAVTLSFFLDEIVPLDENGLLHLRPGVRVIAAPTLFGWNQIADELAECLVDEKIVVHKWHGTFAKGNDLADAFHRTRALEFAAAHILWVHLLGEKLGRPSYPPTEVARVIGGVDARGLPRL